jgi:hypothetical protein
MGMHFRGKFAPIEMATVPSNRENTEANQMQIQNEVSLALSAAYPSAAKSARTVFTVAQFAERNPAFTESAMRNHIFKADEREGANGKIPGNGLLEAGAIIRIGRKVLIDEDRFFEWMEAQNKRGAA